MGSTKVCQKWQQGEFKVGQFFYRILIILLSILKGWKVKADALSRLHLVDNYIEGNNLKVELILII